MSRRIVRYLLSGLAPVLLAGPALLATSPARAQFTVFDPSNYSQNLLTAARELQQINNQIQQLQNQATMLTNQAKNLMRLDFPEVQAITRTVSQIDQLMNQANGISFRVENAGSQFNQLFPQGLSGALTTDARLAAAKSRYDAAMAAYTNTVDVQAGIVGAIASDANTLAAITARSQSAQGQLQASQATNQLLALATQQQLQLQQLLAAQFRSESIDQARRAQAEQEGRETTRRFLGDGHAWTPR